MWYVFSKHDFLRRNLDPVSMIFYFYFYFLKPSLMKFQVWLTLSAHAQEGYNSHFVSLSVCQSVTFPFWRRRRFQG